MLEVIYLCVYLYATTKVQNNPDPGLLYRYNLISSIVKADGITLKK